MAFKKLLLLLQLGAFLQHHCSSESLQAVFCVDVRVNCLVTMAFYCHCCFQDRLLYVPFITVAILKLSWQAHILQILIELRN